MPKSKKRVVSDGDDDFSSDDASEPIVTSDESGQDRRESRSKKASRAKGSGRVASQENRLVKWNSFRESALVLPFPQDSGLRLKSKAQSICVYFDKLSHFRIPKNVMTDSSGKGRVQAHLSVSLFHLETGTFYGNTWTSAPVKIRGGKGVNFEQSICFKTRAVDPSCVAVAEVVVVEKDRSTGRLLRQFGCGWSLLNIFAERLSKASSRGRASDKTIDAPVYTGSPRALMMFNGNSIKESEFKLQRNSVLRYAVALHPKFDKVSKLLGENDIVGASTVVPGFKGYRDDEGIKVPSIGVDRQGTFPLHVPSVVRGIQLQAKSVKVLIPDTLQESISDFLRAAHGVDCNERKGKFVIRIGAHNGHAHLSTKLNVKATLKKAKGKSRGYSTYTSSGRLGVSHVLKDPMVALVFELGYEVPISGDEGDFPSATVSVGSCAWLPFSGANVNLRNSKRGDTRTGLPLQLEFKVPSDKLFPSTFSLPPRTSRMPIYGGFRFDDGGIEGDVSEGSMSDSDIAESGHGSDDLSASEYSGDDPSDRASDLEFSGSEEDDELSVPDIDFRKSMTRRSKKSRSRRTRNGFSHPLFQATAEQFPTYGAFNPAANSLLAASLHMPLGGSHAPRSEMYGARAPPNESGILNTYKPSMHPTMHPRELSSNLTRASSALLSKHGFMDVRDKNQNFAVSVPFPKGSIDAEVKDPLSLNEITFQFAAYRVVRDMNTAQPKSVFFTFQFYDCAPTRTERMKLRPGSSSRRRDREREFTSGVSEPFILTRSSRDHRDEPSLAIKFTVDTGAGAQGEAKSFAQYLQQKTLFIECWDGDSLHCLGVVALELGALMRQGDSFVKSAKEYDIVDSELGGPTVDIHGSTLPGGRVVGKLQLIASNYGSKSHKKSNASTKMLGSSGEAQFPDNANWRVKTAFGSTKRGSTRKPQYRTRARPLASTNPELGRLLKTNASQYEKTKSRGGKRGMRETEWNTMDTFSLSGYEISELIDILDDAEVGEIDVKRFYAFANVRSVGGKGTRKKKTKQAASIDVEKRLRRVLLRAEEEGVDLESSFSHFDKNEDGLISRSEMRIALTELGPDYQVGERELDALLTRFDENNDGFVSYKEFVAFIREDGSKGASKSGIEVALKNVLRQAESEGVDLMASFKHFDKNDDGKINHSEMRKALKELGPKFDVSEQELDRLIEKFDADGDGTVSYSEFLNFVRGEGDAAASRPSSSAAEKLADDLRRVLVKAEEEGVNLTDSFKHFDKDDDGQVTESELREALAELGPSFKASPKDLKALLAQFDEDGDGKVSYSEFIAFVKSRPVAKPASGKSESNATKVEGKLRKVLLKAEEEGINLRESFKHFDKNGDGLISRSEMQEALKELGHDYVLKSQDLTALLQRVCGADYNEEEVSYENFIDFVKNDDSSKRRSKRRGDAHEGEWSLAETEEDAGNVFGKSRFRDRVKKMMQRAQKQDIDIKKAIRAYDGANCGKLSHSDFRALLMTLGVSIAETTEGGDLDLGAVKDQALVERQVSRLDDLRRTRSIQRRSDASVGASGIQASNLNLVRRYREGQKKSIMGKMLRESITTNFTVHPSFGKACYFEFHLTNPYSHEESFKIQFSDPELRVIADSREWRYYRDHVHPEMGSTLGGIEDDMVTPDMHIMLSARESVSVPFVFLSFRSDLENAPSRVIPISFNSQHHGHSVAVMRLRVTPRPFTVHRTLRFNNPADEFLKKCVRFIPSAPASRDPQGTKFVYCTDGKVIVEWKEASASRRTQELFLKYRCGDLSSVADFYIVLYDDAFHASLYEVWRVVVQPMRRLDAHATLGQSRTTELVIRGDTYARRVKCFSTHPGELMCVPSKSFQLVAGAFNKFEVLYRPVSLSSRTIRVHMVDVDSRELVCAWIVRATSSAPTVTKTYDVEIAQGSSSHKKIAYVNNWNQARTFLVRTSNPDLVRVKETEMNIPAKGKGFIRLWFPSREQRTREDVLVFINDQNDQNEECILLKLV